MVATPTFDESEALNQVLTSLPLMDDMFLRMQAQNIAMVNAHIKDVERAMYREYMEHDRTPIPEALFASALSQMWIFAFYELLRTWRQRVGELLSHAERYAKGEVEATDIPDLPYPSVNFHYLEAQRCAEHNAEFRETLQRACDCLESTFRELECVRVTLAKHEAPKSGIKAATLATHGSINYAEA